MLINSLREDKVSFRFRCKRDGEVKPYSARCLVRKSEPIPVLAYQMHKVWEFEPGNVSRDLFFFKKKGKSLVEKINAASWVTVLDLWKWYFRRSLMMNYPKHTTCVMTVGMYIIKKSRFKFLCAYDGCNLTTLILRLLEQIGVSRMVDIDILIQIWKNRIKKIDFVLKRLSTVGSEVGSNKVLYEGILEAGGVMDKCVQMWTKNYGALGQTARVGKGTGGKREGEKEGKRARKRQGLVVLGSGEENPRILLGDADQESEKQMSKNALRTGRRQAVE
ncbi:hypothetical protein TNCV_4876621 [Trichonephila clavipes]|nr:hypothetical protein TNCV_4876621 [Trichonephila clavipes]